MKTIKTFLLSMLLALSTFSFAQTIRPLSADQPNAVFVKVGLNQAVVAVSLGYQRRLSDRSQLLLGAEAAAVEKFLSNSRVYAGLQHHLFEKGRFMLPLRLLGSTAFADNPLYQAVNLSAELSLHPQLHFSRWTLGADASYRQGLATHFTHADRYRILAYADAVDGWYKYPSATFRAGASISYLVGALEVGMQSGYQANAQYDLFLPPYYGVLTTNFRF
jgi:hypothetical protein